MALQQGNATPGAARTAHPGLEARGRAYPQEKTGMIVESLGERLVPHESPPYRYFGACKTNRSLSAPITS
jgi:hypothetical protein